MPKRSLAEQLINSPLAAKAGVPQGYPLRRYQPGAPALTGPVAFGGGNLAEQLRERLSGDYDVVPPQADSQRAGIVFDATGLSSPAQLRELYDFFHPQLRALAPNGRIVLLGTTPAAAADAPARIAARALEGFSRSIAKELRKGATANLIYVDAEPQAEPLEAAVRFFLSAKSAYVDGQVLTIGAQASAPRDLSGKVAVVTGAARGIGATIAEVLSREGARVICVDIPQASEYLARTANKVSGTALPLDVTADNAAEAIAEHARARYGGGIDIVVHNAGITRDKLLVNMDSAQWDAVMAVNLFAPLTITTELLALGALNSGAAIIGVSSMAGIAGNRGQTNYATTKAGIIGLVDALSAELGQQDITINAVAPGFIETAMTAAMPTGPREIGRRMNSLQQGGLPVDVAELVTYFAGAGVSGNTVRVCGQNVMGA